MTIPSVRAKLSTGTTCAARRCCSATTISETSSKIFCVSKLRAEVRPKIWRHDVSRGIIKSLISMNTGISLVFEADIGANFAGLVYRELRDGAGASRFEFSAYWRADNENPALHEFLKLLSQRYPSPSAGR